MKSVKCAFMFGLSLAVVCQVVHALDNGVARTPPMGWSTWNPFCNRAPVSIDSIKEAIDSLESKGLLKAGYVYMNGDAGSSLSSLIANLHSRGFKVGAYSGAGGTPGNEASRARSLATSGYDYIKYDYFNTPVTDSTWARMRDGLAAAGRPILFSAHCSGEAVNASVPGYANMWRTGQDIYIPWEQPNWNKVVINITMNSNSAAYAKPGYWNDPDYLLIGLTDTWAAVGYGAIIPFTPDENRTQFNLWCISAAPLILSVDTRFTYKENIAILTNSEVIAIDQDSLGYQGRPVKKNADGTQIWSKNLLDGSKAVMLFNGSAAPLRICVHWSDIGLSGTLTVRDLWAHADLGSIADSLALTSVPAHGSSMFRVNGGASGISWCVGNGRAAGESSPRWAVVNPICQLMNSEGLPGMPLFDLQGRRVGSFRPVSASLSGVNRSVILVRKE